MHVVEQPPLLSVPLDDARKVGNRSSDVSPNAALLRQGRWERFTPPEARKVAGHLPRRYGSHEAQRRKASFKYDTAARCSPGVAPFDAALLRNDRSAPNDFRTAWRGRGDQGLSSRYQCQKVITGAQ
jgi:hypothetical protein